MAPSAAAGGVHLRRALERSVAGLREVHEALPDSWRLLIPAAADPDPADPVPCWGTASLAAAALGDRVQCLLGVPASGTAGGPAVAAARLIQAGRFGGLAAGQASEETLFRVFLEILDAEGDRAVDAASFRPLFRAVPGGGRGDPIEEALAILESLGKAWVRALLVDRASLASCQERGDGAGAALVLRAAADVDVRPILRRARLRRGAAIDPIPVYRRSRYRAEKARERGPRRALEAGL